MAYVAGQNPNLPQYNGGVVPITIENMDPLQVQGLQELANLNYGGMVPRSLAAGKQLAANPQAFAQQYISPTAASALNNMGAAIGRGTQGFTMADLANYMNPYTQQVTDATVAGINEDAARERARLTANQGLRGSRSFGDTSTGVQNAELTRNMGTLLGKTRADLNYKGFGDAMTQFNTQQDRTLQGAGLYGNQAATAQDIFSNGLQGGINSIGSMTDLGNSYYNARRQQAVDKGAAGDAYYNFNQNVANQIGSEINKVVGLDSTRLSELAKYLGAFMPSSYDYIEKPNAMQRLGSVEKDIGNMYLGLANR